MVYLQTIDYKLLVKMQMFFDTPYTKRHGACALVSNNL